MIQILISILFVLSYISNVLSTCERYRKYNQSYKLPCYSDCIKKQLYKITDLDLKLACNPYGLQPDIPRGKERHWDCRFTFEGQCMTNIVYVTILSNHQQPQYVKK